MHPVESVVDEPELGFKIGLIEALDCGEVESDNCNESDPSKENIEDITL